MKTKHKLIADATNRIWDEFSKERIRGTLEYLWVEISKRGYDQAIEDIRSGKIVINKEKFHRTLNRS